MVQDGYTVRVLPVRAASAAQLAGSAHPCADLDYAVKQ
jgi:hypothetical protein